MKILIADDHQLLRRGLIQILVDKYPDAQFGEAGNSAETLECLSQQSWDILVLDIFMPGRSGLDVLLDIRRLYPKLPVLVLSSAPEEQLAIRVLKLGANGFLNKQTAPEELYKAVKKILYGERYVSAATAERLAAEISYATQHSHTELTDREYAVLQLLSSGKSIKEIADELFISPKTVSTYHTRIWEKFHVDNDVKMVRYALDHGLIGNSTGNN